VLGLPPGQRVVAFIDDIAAPAPDQPVSSGQPPLELLRTLVDAGGWHGADGVWCAIAGVQLVAALTTTKCTREKTAGQERLLRHFSAVSLTAPDDGTLASMFGTILEWHLAGRSGGAAAAPDPVRSLATPLAAATCHVYRAAVAAFLATPDTPHYAFTARDAARVITGMCAVPAASLGRTAAPVATAHRLWLHETLRAFGDRLAKPADAAALLAAARAALARHAGVRLDDTVRHITGGAPATPEHMRRLIFTDVLDTAAAATPGSGGADATAQGCVPFGAVKLLGIRLAPGLRQCLACTNGGAQLLLTAMSLRCLS
jgi:P-loop containing dynein motor region/AAA+ lid domain